MAGSAPLFDPKDYNGDDAQLLMLNCLLFTRIAEEAEPHDSAGHRFEEEVDTYLESIRRGISEPASIEHLTPYLFDYDIEVLRRLNCSSDAKLRYTICRTKDDVLTLSVGIFDSAGEKALPLGPELKHGSQGQMGRGQAYYHFAFSYCGRVTSIAEAVGLLKEKVAIGFEKFATILAYATGKNFDLAQRLREGEIYHLTRAVETTFRRRRLERKQNEFLDAYLEWRRRRTEETKQLLLLIADELRQLDPNFTYIPV